MTLSETRIGLKYGKAVLELDLGGLAAQAVVLEPKRATAAGPQPSAGTSDEAALVREALAAPLASLPLAQLVAPGQKVVVITSDITRPCPSARLLPPLLDELNRGGVDDGDITVVLGLGTHRPHTAEERRELLGEAVLARVRCIDSDPADVELVGHTRRGTPVAVFRPVLEADVRVLVGNLEYHYFAGYSGGYKAIVPGVCGAETVRHNHGMMVEPGAQAGALDGNPVREDIDEGGAMIGARFILNAILDGDKRIVDAVAGHPLAAHRQGCARLDAFGRATVDRLADLVVVSAGGYPKDINLYQAQKALDNARLVVRPGGAIVLVAECREGLGNRTFESWMLDPGGPEAIVARIRREFVLGGHKAAAVAVAMQQATIYMVSALPPELVQRMGFVPSSLDEAIAGALRQVGPAAQVVVMPEGGAVLPAVKEAFSG